MVTTARALATLVLLFTAFPAAPAVLHAAIHIVASEHGHRHDGTGTHHDHRHDGSHRPHHELPELPAGAAAIVPSPRGPILTPRAVDLWLASAAPGDSAAWAALGWNAIPAAPMALGPPSRWPARSRAPPPARV